MRSAFRWTSTALFVLLGVFLIAFGALYASVTDLLFFHAAAVPPAALEAVRPIYFALMKLIGGSSAALGLLAIYVALVPLRARIPFAGAALTVAIAIPVVMAAVVAERLAAATGAPTSWHIMGILLAIDAAAYGAHVASSGGTPRSAQTMHV